MNPDKESIHGTSGNADTAEHNPAATAERLVDVKSDRKPRCSKRNAIKILFWGTRSRHRSKKRKDLLNEVTVLRKENVMISSISFYFTFVLVYWFTFESSFSSPSYVRVPFPVLFLSRSLCLVGTFFLLFFGPAIVTLLSILCDCAMFVVLTEANGNHASLLWLSTHFGYSALRL